MRVRDGKWPQKAIPRPLYIIKFYIYKSKFSWFSEIPARAAVRAVLSIWTRERVRTRIKNGKWPQNAIPRPLYIIKFYVYKSKFFAISKILAPEAVRAVLSFTHVWPRGQPFLVYNLAGKTQIKFSEPRYKGK